MGASSAHFPTDISLPGKGAPVGPHIVFFEVCSAFTHVAACTLARSPIRDQLSEGFRHFVASMSAPAASGWSGRRVGLAPTGKAPPCHGARGERTLLNYQVVGTTRYFDAAGFPGRTLGLDERPAAVQAARSIP